MGSYLFKWQRPATEVYVTGTFDDWAKSVKLENEGHGFQKRVNLPPATKNIYYKFVVDGNWTTNDDHPIEADEHGNLNNFLKPEELEAPIAVAGGLAAGGGLAAATMSTVGPKSTTAKLAGDVPKETGAAKDVPRGFPETPAGDSQQFSVKPIPASAGAGNPISLNPGEKIPDTSRLATNNVTTADTLDKESYEKGGDGAAAALAAKNPTLQSVGAGTSAAALAGLVPKEPRREAQVIPESANTSTPSYPTIQSAGAGATTAALAAEIPKEPRKEAQVLSDTSKPAADVPEVVQESIADAHTGPEAAANAEAVKEKSAMESELLKDVKPSEAKGEPAPTASAATASKAPEPTSSTTTPATAGALEPSSEKQKEAPSRDVSPLSNPKQQPGASAQPDTNPITATGPTVTTGVGSATTATKTEGDASSPASKASTPGTTDKKAKRASIFGRLKEKFKHHDK